MPNSFAASKAEIRQAMRERRKALTTEERTSAARTVCGKIISLHVCGVVAVYLASPDEIDLSAAIVELLERGVTVVAPRWNGETYELAKVRSLREGDLREGPMGIREPKEAAIVSPREVTVWFLPGLAFTRSGKRLGYGGGWYDRLLATAAPEALKYGIAHPFQVVADLPTDPHDIALTGVLTSL